MVRVTNPIEGGPVQFALGQSLAASSNSKSLNHYFSSVSIVIWLWTKPRKMISKRSNSGVVMPEEGGHAARVEMCRGKR
jgi:hypothetical protein